MILVQFHYTPLGHGQQLCEILPDSTWQWGVMARARILGICALWPWPWRNNLGSMSWHTLGSGHSSSLPRLIWIIFHTIVVHDPKICHDLDPMSYLQGQGHSEITLGQCHDTPLGHGQQLCEILSRSNLAVRSYGQDTDYMYMCTVTLTLQIWPWVKVMTHPLVKENNCVNYFPDWTSCYEVIFMTSPLGVAVGLVSI